MVSKHAAACGKDAGEQIVGARALDLRRDAFALRHAQQLQRAVRGPAPARLEDRRSDGGLFQQLLRGVLGEEVEDVGEREAVLLGEADVDAVVGGRGLQFEVEAAAEALAQREAPGLVDAAAERRVQDELHAAALVEEALGDDGGLRGNGSEHRAPGDDVRDQLPRGGGADAAAFHQPRDAGGDLGMARRHIGRGDVGSARGNLSRSSLTPSHSTAVRCGASPNQKGKRGRRAVRVFHQDAAGGFHALNAPAGVAEQDDIAGAGVDGEVLVERGDLYAFRLQISR
jgi:hypothetical protein